MKLQREMSPSEKMQLAFEWSEMVRQFAEAGLREKYPQASEREIFLRFARQSLGEELFRKVYGSGAFQAPGAPRRQLAT